MREILFRGKAKDGKWIISTYMNHDEKRELLLNELELFDGKKWVAVNPNTFGQYTGLKDKNGTTIFEGDIVRDIAGGLYKVVYDTEYMRFAFEQDSIKWGLEGFDNIMCFEVIGNIFDNIELLNGETK